MKFVLSLCAALLMFDDPRASLARELAADPAALADIAKWKDKYPFDKIEGRTLFANPELKKLLVATMGADETKKFFFYGEHGPNSPVGVLGKYVILDACKAHDCGDEHFTVVVDVQSPRAYVCRATTLSRARDQVTWITADRPRVTAPDCDVAEEPGPTHDRKLIELIPKSLQN